MAVVCSLRVRQLHPQEDTELLAEECVLTLKTEQLRNNLPFDRMVGSTHFTDLRKVL